MRVEGHLSAYPLVALGGQPYRAGCRHSLGARLIGHGQINLLTFGLHERGNHAGVQTETPYQGPPQGSAEREARDRVKVQVNSLNEASSVESPKGSQRTRGLGSPCVSSNRRFIP